MKRKHFMYLTMATLLLNSCTPKETNPFLTEYTTPYQVPPFDEIKTEHYLPAIEAGFKQQIAEIEAIINNTDEPDFKNTIEALEFSGKILGKVNGVLDNLTSSHYTEELLAVSRQIAPLASQHGDNISMNPTLFQKVKAVYEKRDALNLNTEELKLVEETYKNFERGGANLSAEEQEKMKAINEELSLLSIKFRDNSNKDGNAFMLVLENEADLAGLPQGTLDAAAMAAKHHEMDGKWVVTLDNPSRIPFLQYSSRRDLREKVYSAYIQRGNNDNEFDNKEVLRRILSLRVQKANLLGFKTHADYVLEKRMAQNPEEIFELCNQLMERANIAAKKEVKELQKMITNSGEKFKLASWDWSFYTEKLRKQRYDLDEEELRPYFELNNVRNGVFEVSTKLFDITFKERTDIPTYHPEASVYEVSDLENNTIGILYMDFHPRASKNSGAWMNAYRKQYRKDGVRIPPVITVVCNFSKPTETTPALLTFDEVSTLFHEFGHALHGLLSQCEYASLSGTSVPRDFVELPSQIMENWASEPEVLKMFAKHYKTGEVIPMELIKKMEASSKFNQGFTVSEFQAAALLDMYWHTLESSEIPEVTEFEKNVRAKIGLIPEIDYRYRTTYFNHIFASGYSAGYYSYTWAEILDADAFEAFKETSLFDKQTAAKFKKNILEGGGVVDAMDMYVNFRGRKPSIDALLLRKGI